MKKAVLAREGEHGASGKIQPVKIIDFAAKLRELEEREKKPQK